MNKLLAGVGAVALLAVLVLGVTLPKVDVSSVTQGPQGVQGSAGPRGSEGPQGERGSAGPAGQGVAGLENLLSALKGVVTSLQNQPSRLGAVVGTDLPNPYCQGGLCTQVVSGVCADATTTLARIDNPFNGTSTVTLATVKVTNPATTSVKLTVATSTQGAGFVVTGEATSTGLLNRVHLAAFATSSLSSDSANYTGLNNGGRGGVGGIFSTMFDVGPKANITTATTTGTNKVTIGVNAQDEDSLLGVTNAVNNFSCTYAVRFEANETVR